MSPAVEFLEAGSAIIGSKAPGAEHLRVEWDVGEGGRPEVRLTAAPSGRLIATLSPVGARELRAHLDEFLESL